MTITRCYAINKDIDGNLSGDKDIDGNLSGEPSGEQPSGEQTEKDD